MIIPMGFDEANAERKKRIYETALRTAEKLNSRVCLFMADIDTNPSLTQRQKDVIKGRLISGK
jgi:hypothetical protein